MQQKATHIIWIDCDIPIDSSRSGKSRRIEPWHECCHYLWKLIMDGVWYGLNDICVFENVAVKPDIVHLLFMISLYSH